MNADAAARAVEEPFFLVGAVRSGTTMLRLMLGHHSQICRCNETEFVASAIAGRHDWPNAARWRRDVQALREFRELGIDLPERASFVESARDVLRAQQRADGRPLIGATVHNHFDELPRVWPSARYIHLVRDPRDVARSCVQMGWAGNAWEGATLWLAAEQAWQRLRATLPPDRCLEVRYESLIDDTVAELERITQFLGVAFEPGMLDIEQDSTYRRPDPHAARSWRQGPRRDVVEVEGRLGAALQQAGYTPSGWPASQPSAARRAWLRVEHRIGRMRFGQRRYGFGLWLAGVLTRRLPFSALRLRVLRAIQNIDLQHLK